MIGNVSETAATWVHDEILHRDSLLAEVIRRLAAFYQPALIYLFGSKARGDFRVGSDYDLMVLLPDDAPSERRDCTPAYDLLWEIGAAADVLVWLRSDFERRAHVVTSLPATVLREGKLLYAA